MSDPIDMVEDVLDFHRAIDAIHHIGSTPSVPRDQVRLLKWCLVREEFEELEQAVSSDDVVGVADACADLIYVVIGLALAYGIDLRPVWRDVQKSNLAKSNGPQRADGKRMKPAGWVPPDVAGILARQTSLHTNLGEIREPTP